MQSDFIYNKSTQKMAEEYQLTPDELAVVDLVTCGWGKEEAFTLIYRAGGTWTKLALATEIARILKSPGARKRKKFLRGQYTEEEVIDENNKPIETKPAPTTVAELVSKEAMLQELITAKKGMMIGSKEWIDVNKMIADLTRMKQDEIKTEDTTIHFYLPLQCCQCELYNKSKKR